MSIDSPHEGRVEKRIPQGSSNGSDQLISTLVSAVAECTGQEETDLEPLYEAIDPDAMEQLYEPRDGRIGANGVQTKFTYAGCDVLVTKSKVTVHPKERQRADD